MNIYYKIQRVVRKYAICLCKRMYDGMGYIAREINLLDSAKAYVETDTNFLKHPKMFGSLSNLNCKRKTLSSFANKRNMRRFIYLYILTTWQRE